MKKNTKEKCNRKPNSRNDKWFGASPSSSHSAVSLSLFPRLRRTQYTQHTSSKCFVHSFTTLCVRFHFFLLSCSFLFDSVKIVGTFMPRRTWLLLLLFGGGSAHTEPKNCAVYALTCATTTTHEAHETSHAERPNVIVVRRSRLHNCTTTHWTECGDVRACIRIRRFLGRRTEEKKNEIPKVRRTASGAQHQCKLNGKLFYSLDTNSPDDCFLLANFVKLCGKLQMQ